MFLGNRLKFIRIQNKMTQEDLSKQLELKRTTISKIELNKITPTLKTLENLIEIFNVSIYFFLDKEPSDNPKPLPFNIVPSEFTDKEDCIEYLSKHEKINNLNLDLHKLNEDELISLANEIQEYIGTLTYKYKR